MIFTVANTRQDAASRRRSRAHMFINPFASNVSLTATVFLLRLQIALIYDEIKKEKNIK